ncbi:hypothetical protein SAMN04488030_1270 [Aliiroseovarius halocynthiae]|uniref:hypothetical protein n=1 Tax=Aliiroseovarius halocynthiae TaxID=985055 RepID=UPI001C8F241C|nr:hypothetical protein [Aliiroseovarius halocynthiae]SMR71930.1 hypothetical protein SAMN04488030_1270 [Aliiroseovarius halocynthiae]
MDPRWLLRMSKWARNPPSARRVILGIVVLAICLALFAYEYFIGAPDWMEIERIRRP